MKNIKAPGEDNVIKEVIVQKLKFIYDLFLEEERIS